MFEPLGIGPIMNMGYSDNPDNGTDVLPVAYGTNGHVSPTSAMFNMAVTYNASSNTTVPRIIKRDEFLAMIEILLQVAIILLALIGNLCVLTSLWRKRRTLTRMHIFIMHLAIVDLLSVFLGVLPQLLWDITFKFMAPDFVCRFVKFIQVAMGMYLPTYVLVMTALDRYMAICHPMSGMKGTQVRVRIMIGTAWMMSLIFSIPQLFIFHLSYHAPGFPFCSSQRWFIRVDGPKIYFTTVTIMVIVLPTFILAWAYGMIWREVWRNAQLKTQWENKAHRPTYANGHAHSYSNSLRNGDLHPNSRGTLIPRTHYSGRGITKAKIKMAKMTLVIVIVYFLCWTPFFYVQLWVAYAPNASIEAPVIVVLQLLATLNSCTNPWIYMAFSGNLLHELKHVCCGHRVGLFRRSGTMNSSDRDYRYGSARFYKTAATRTGSCTTGVSLMPNKTACVNFTSNYNYDGEAPPVTSVSSESHSRARESSSLPTTPTSSDTKQLAAKDPRSRNSDVPYVEMFTSV